MTKKKDPILEFVKRHVGEDKLALGMAQSPGKVRVGLPTVDWVMAGGMPRGRMVEMFGREGSGKSSLACRIAAAFQREGDQVWFFDCERGLDEKWATLHGLDTEKMIVSRTAVADPLTAAIRDIIEQAETPTLILVDSVAAVSTAKELETALSALPVAAMARVWSAATRIWNAQNARGLVTLLLINQNREAIGSYIPMDVQPGGRQMKHQATIRMAVARAKKITEKRIAVGHEVRLKTVKNKVGPPFREGTLALYFDRGFDDAEDIARCASQAGIVEGSGGWVTWDGAKMRTTDFRDTLRQDEAARLKVLNAIYESGWADA